MLSPLAFWLGLSGLLPFLVGPLWLMLSPATAPAWLDAAWHQYLAMITSFMAGTFWGFAVPLSGGTGGLLGLLMSAGLMLLSWAAMALPFGQSLMMLGAVLLLLLLADFWRDRVLDSIEGYFRLRVILTIGVLVCIGWRLLLA